MNRPEDILYDALVDAAAAYLLASGVHRGTERVAAAMQECAEAELELLRAEQANQQEMPL